MCRRRRVIVTCRCFLAPELVKAISNSFIKKRTGSSSDPRSRLTGCGPIQSIQIASRSLYTDYADEYGSTDHRCGTVWIGAGSAGAARTDRASDYRQADGVLAR